MIRFHESINLWTEDGYERDVGKLHLLLNEAIGFAQDTITHDERNQNDATEEEQEEIERAGNNLQRAAKMLFFALTGNKVGSVEDGSVSSMKSILANLEYEIKEAPNRPIRVVKKPQPCEICRNTKKKYPRLAKGRFATFVCKARHDREINVLICDDHAPALCEIHRQKVTGK